MKLYKITPLFRTDKTIIFRYSYDEVWRTQTDAAVELVNEQWEISG